MLDISTLINDFQSKKINFEEIFSYYKNFVFSLAKKYFIFDYINDISSKLWSIVSILDISKFKNSIEIDGVASGKCGFHTLRAFSPLIPRVCRLFRYSKVYIVL